MNHTVYLVKKVETSNIRVVYEKRYTLLNIDDIKLFEQILKRFKIYVSLNFSRG